MAKAKSKKTTIEDALVPVEEQPYEVPDNWCWVKPLSIIEIEYGKGLPTKKLTEDGYPVFGANGQIGYYSEYMLEKPMALMSCRGAYSGTMNLSLPYSFVTSNSLIMKDKGAFISEKYIYYMFSALNTGSLVSGSAQPQVTVQAFSDFAVPIPPLPEQQRIVEQIESLFSKLDEAKEKAQEVLSNSTKRCAAILKDVFNGALSKKWREDNNVDLESWKKIPFEDCIVKMQNGLSKRSGNEGEAIPVLRLANLGDDDFDISDLREIRLTEKEQDSYILEPNDIVMIRVNGSRDNVGKQLIIKEKTNWAFCDHIIRIKVSDLLVPEFLVMFSKTDEYRYYIEEHMVSSAGQNTISRKGLSDLSIYSPSVKEQIYLVKIADKLLTKERNIKDKIEDLFEMIELMKKSILAKAFRGELGTNDLTEESSTELLKRL